MCEAKHATGLGYGTDKWRNEFLSGEIAAGRISKDAHRMPHVLALTPSSDPAQRLFFWQLYAVLGEDNIQQVVTSFYRRVFHESDAWFRDAFARISGLRHHITTQMAMWCDAFGGGHHYHGGEYRLNFHHEHNAKQVMTRAGAEHWVRHMRDTLADPAVQPLLTNDPRVKDAIVDFLEFFIGKYARQFRFDAEGLRFGRGSGAATGARVLSTRSDAAIAGLGAAELKRRLLEVGADIKGCLEKDDLVQLAQAVARPPADSMSVADVKGELAALGVDFARCVEKEELYALLAESRSALNSAPNAEPGEVPAG